MVAISLPLDELMANIDEVTNHNPFFFARRDVLRQHP